jgi:hypothetical protein
MSDYVENEKRRDADPIPENLEDWLSQDQLDALKQLGNFGWQLKFIRRPVFQDPIVIVYSRDKDQFGILEKDGKIDMDSGITIRD